MAEGITVPIMGHPIRGHDARTLTYLFNDVFMSGHYAVELDADTPTIVDCGANIGLATLLFKIRYPAATVRCLEANPATFRMLETNVRANGLHGVRASNEAVWSAEGEIELFVGADPGGLRASVRRERGGDRAVRVPTVRLSRVLGSLPTVDLVKLDVEGAEHAVLEDLLASGTIAVPRQYVIEYHHQVAGDAPRLAPFLAAFEQAGFRYHLAARRGRAHAFQDVVIHAVRSHAPE